MSLIRLAIGVTGHRDLPEASIAPIEEAVRSIFAEIRAAAPNTPIDVLSQLAEGADRVVARVALQLGLRLIVPLPMALERYEEDFETFSSKRDFRELLRSSSRVITLPDAVGSRSAAYAQAGAYIARHTSALIAVWNGVDSKKEGGTSDVVRYKLEGVPSVAGGHEYLLLRAETGRVFQIASPRMSDPTTTIPPHTTARLDPQSDGNVDLAHRMFAHLVMKTEAFNRDVTVLEQATRNDRIRTRTTLLQGSDPATLDEASSATLDLFEWADAMAIWYQTRTSKLMKTLFITVFLAVLAFELFGHRVWSHPFALALYLLLLGAAGFAYRLSTHRRHQDKHVDYRALAEGLRVQYYWQLAGVPDSAADHYLRQQRQELEWIRAAMRGRSSATFGPPPERIDRLPFVLDNWVAGQSDYFERTLKRYEREHEKAKRRIGLLVGVGIASAVGLLLLLGLGPYLRGLQFFAEWLEHTPPAHGLAVLLIGIPPVAAALLHGYVEEKALPSHIKRYARTHILYGDAQRQLDLALNRNDIALARAILSELGRDALDENTDWVVVVRDRPLEVPHPA